MKIIPAIIGEDFEDIESKIKSVEGAVEWVQIDIVDGEFASPASWPYNQDDLEGEIAKLNDLKTDCRIELHLMIANPEDTLDEWIDTKAERIFVHHEATNQAELDLTVLDMTKTQSGVSLLMNTPTDVVEKYVDRVDDIQLMSIRKIGSYGAEFDDEVIERIKEVRELHPKIKINVDGGINKDNIKLLKTAGANNAVIGSAIFNTKDPRKTIEELKKLVS